MNHWVRALLNDLDLDRREYPEHVRSGLNRIASFVENQYEYVFRLPILDEIYEEILLCEDLTDLAGLLMKAAKTTGFEHVTLHIIDPGTETNFTTYLCTSYSKKWIKRYQEKSYRYIDPVAVRASASDGTFNFSELDKTSPLAKDFWKDAVAHGVGENGYSVVTTQENAARVHACFTSLGSSKETAELIRLNESDIKHVINCAIEVFLALTSGRQYNGNELSCEELRYLKDLAVKGTTAGLQMSEAERHALNQGIVRKLGVETMYQAVAIAGSKGWLNNVDNSMDEILWILD